MLWEIVAHAKSEEERRKRLDVLADMKVSDWMLELRSLLNYSNTGCEETWT